MNDAPTLHCTLDGCTAAVLARGLCSTHYNRQARHGSPHICKKPMVKRGVPLAWIYKHTSWDRDECLTWPFARFPDGRAHMSAGKPSRIMCEAAHGAPPSPRHEAAHSCGKGHLACVNPRHLRWATPKENAADKHIHNTTVYGERHYLTRLTDDQVRQIRQLRGKMQGKEVAEKFGISPVTVSGIQLGSKRKRVA